LYENAPCGYLSLDPGGRIFKVNKTLCDWVGYAPEHMLAKRLGDLLNIAGRMFYETHIAPLLRMQGFFNEVALDLVSESGERLPVIANAAERRAADGSVISTRVTLLKAADRRRYEQELLNARDRSRSSEAATRAILKDEREDVPTPRAIHCRPRPRPEKPVGLDRRGRADIASAGQRRN
jgi:sigma-B regulation protein RsbU (phosphoserine phosphatase)